MQLFLLIDGVLYLALLSLLKYNLGNYSELTKTQKGSIMKKVKQILAIIGVVLLLSLYIMTFVFSITDNTDTQQMFKASIVATVIIPVLLWAYSFIYKLLKNHYGKDSGTDTPSSSK